MLQRTCAYLSVVVLLSSIACDSTSGHAATADASDATCPAGGNFSAPGSNVVAADGVCQRTAELQCAGERCCCTDNARAFASREDCITAMHDGCVQAQNGQMATVDPRAGYDTAAATSAFDGLGHYVSTCDVGVVAWGVTTAGLAGMMKGTVEAGGNCWNPITDGVDLPAFVSCKDGNACLPDPGKVYSTWTCKPRGQSGEICLGDFSCVDGLRCDPNLSTNPAQLGHCTDRLPLGESCDRGLACQSLFCEGGTCVEPSVNRAYCLAPTK